MKTTVYERNDYKTADEIAALLVKLYAEYKAYTGYHDKDYAEAVGIAIRMLTD